jgi:hypothetical protein
MSTIFVTEANNMILGAYKRYVQEALDEVVDETDPAQFAARLANFMSIKHSYDLLRAKTLGSGARESLDKMQQDSDDINERIMSKAVKAEAKEDNLVPSEVVNLPVEEEDTDSVLSAREQADQDRLFERIVVSSHMAKEEAEPKRKRGRPRKQQPPAETPNRLNRYKFTADFICEDTYSSTFGYQSTITEALVKLLDRDGGKLISVQLTDHLGQPVEPEPEVRVPFEES